MNGGDKPNEVSTTTVQMAPMMSSAIQFELFNGESDITYWFTRFERTCRFTKTTADADKANAIGPCMRGNAVDVYEALDEEVKEDYEKLKEALKSKYGMQCDTAYEKFHNAVLGSKESPQEFASRLKNLASIFTDCTTDRTRFVKMQFMLGLPSDIAQKMKGMSLKFAELSLEDRVKGAECLLGASRSQQKSSQPAAVMAIQQPVDIDNMVRQVMAVVKEENKRKFENVGPYCNKCGTKNHPKDKCFVRAFDKCRKCGDKGHHARACPNKTSLNENGGH